jgi:hypothetical protein
LKKSSAKQAGSVRPWSEVTRRINEQRSGAERESPRSKSPSPDVVAIIRAYRRDPVGQFLNDPWVRWTSEHVRLEPDQYVHDLIRLANGETVSFERTFGLSSGVALNDAELRATQVTPSDKEWLERWRIPLRLIAGDQRAAARELRAELLTEINANGVFKLVGEASEGVPQFILLTRPSRGLKTALSYGLYRLLDPSGPGKSLCQCKHRDCGKFFFAERQKDLPGRLKRDYCSDEHREEEQRMKVAERVRKHREKVIMERRKVK